MDKGLFVYGSSGFSNYLEAHPYERGEVQFLESITEEGMNAIDVGANMGITTVTIANRIGERGRLYSFEPLPGPLGALKRNLRYNGLKNVKAYQLAVTDQVGAVDVYEKGLSSGIVYEAGTKKLNIPTTTIDRFLIGEREKRIDLLNMDCEGSELLVLRGAKETLRENKLKIFCEIHHDFLRQLGQSIDDIVKYLTKLSFEVRTVSLHDLKMGTDFGNCEYIYAHNLTHGRYHVEV